MTEFFDRYTELIIKNPSSKTEKTITSDELEIVFQTRVYDIGETSIAYGVSANTDAPTVIADIGVFNLSDETIKDIRHETRISKETKNDDDTVTKTITRTGGSVVTLISGYKGHCGVVFTGVVAAMEQEEHGSDVLTILACRDENRIVRNAVVSVSYKNIEGTDNTGMTISQLVTQLANMADIPIGRIDSIDIPVSARTYTQTQSLDDIFKEILAECILHEYVVRYRFKHGALYFTNAAITERTVYDLSPSTGLLSLKFARDAVFANDSYDVTTAMLPDIEWMGAVKISTVEGDYICSVTTKPTYKSDGVVHTTSFTATVADEYLP